MKNDLKNRLAAGETCIGAWVQAPSPQNVEAMVTCGFDWMAVDMEHGTHSVDQAVTCFLAAERHGVAPLARIPSADPYLARRLLDNGAHGIIVPVVEYAAAFAAFASHCLYPPRGQRGVGLSRPTLWGGTFKEYEREFQPVLIPQIETVKGVANADAIAALDVVDGLFIGPYDLSADQGYPGNFERPEFLEATVSVRDSCRRHGKAEGIHQVEPSLAKLRETLERGFRFVAYGTDLIAVRYAFRELADLTRKDSCS